jgi:hypothetical protein
MEEESKTKPTSMKERENHFLAGYDDGARDKREKTGRSLSEEFADYGAGYVAGKYGQLLGFKVSTLNEALDIQTLNIWTKQQ